MAIGTDKGEYFEDGMEYRMKKFGTNDNNVVDPDATPDLNVQDPIESDPEYRMDKMKNPGITKVSDIEDRRNQGMFDTLKSWVGDQFTMDKVHAIMQHPWADTTQTMTANLPEPAPNQLSKDAGIDALRMPLGGGTEPAGALKSSGDSQTPGNSQKVDLPDVSDIPFQELFGKGEHDIRPALQNFYEGVKNAFKLPGDVYGGKIDPMSQQGIERAADLAGLMVMGPAPVAAKMADGTLGSFAGVKSAGRMGKYPDLGRAVSMESEGFHPEDIYRQTGFFQGMDKKWRYELDDSKAKFDKDWIQSAKFPEQPKTLEEFQQHPFDPHMDKLQKPLTEVLDHPDLYKAYPFLEGTRVISDPTIKNAEAYWDRYSNAVILKNSGDKSAVLHELQHAIQDHEEHARGAGFIGTPDTQSILNYARSAGEVEARNTEARQLLTEQERRRFMPWDTHDIKTKYQIPTRGVGVGTPEGLVDTATNKLRGRNLQPSLDMLPRSVGPEAIRSAALKYGPDIIEGENHGMALNNLMEKHPDKNISFKNVQDGFTTTHGRFVSREEAFDIADKQKQIDPRVSEVQRRIQQMPGYEDHTPMLLSEDIGASRAR